MGVRSGFARLALCLIPLLAGCGEQGAGPSPKEPPSFVLVVVDTLRADRLGYAGFAPARTPAFDRLARQSLVLDAAYATTSWTLPSTASLFTSQYVSQHRVSSWGSRLAPEQPTFVEGLRAEGYRTGMWTANLVVAGRRGFAARFEAYELVRHPDFRPEPPLSASAFGAGTTISERALRWIRARVAGEGGVEPRPFFAYLHYMEPHGPYLCPEDAPADCTVRARALNARILDLDWDLDADERALLQSLYDADVARMDDALAQLVEGLRDAGVLDRTWLFVVSDHGELLGEAGMYGHGRTLFEEMIRVPVLIRPPGDGAGPARGRRHPHPVSLVDVAPTILDLAGLPNPDAFVGRSLRPLLEGGALSQRPVLAELLQVGAEPDPRQRHAVAVRDGDVKLLQRMDGLVERIDLAAGARRNDASEPSEEAAGRLAQLLEELGVDSADARGQAPAFREPTPRMRRQLEALGYLREDEQGGGANGSAER